MNTPEQTAAIAVDYLLTAYNRVRIMSVKEVNAFKKQLDRTAFTNREKEIIKEFLFID